MRWIGDLSVGQRLFGGFGIMLLVLGIFGAAVFSMQQRSAEAQSALVEHYLPRSERAVAVERAILRVAVAVRAQLIAPDDRHRAALAEAIDAAATALRALEEVPKDDDGARIFRETHPAIERYLAEAKKASESGLLENPRALETSLASAREESVWGLRRYGDAQAEKAQAAMDAMVEARRGVDRGLAAAIAASLLLLAVVALMIGASIREPARRLTRVAQDLQAGRWQPALQFAPAAVAARGESLAPRDELKRIALAFGAAAQALESRARRLRADADIATAATSDLDKQVIAQEALRVLAEATGAGVGAFYWRTPGEPRLVPLATRATAAPLAPVRFGEGLPGQAAQEGRLLVLDDIPEDTPLRLRLGVDEAVPRTVVAVPAMLRGEALGVVVLASLRPFDAEALDFLRAASLQLAVGLQNVRSHEELQRLVADLQEAQERLQAQNEELQAQNEEIQAQGEELQAQNEEIHAQGEELQAQNEELQRQAAELARADERKNQFIGLLAHELRNPLAAIANSLFLVGHRGGASPEQQRALEVIQRQMRYLTRLIDDLLDVTRISHGKLHLQREPLDLAELVRQGVHDARGLAESAGITLAADVPPQPTYVDGDRTRLAQVLGNLVSNAAKFTPRGGRIEVTLREEGGRAALYVRDSGVGMEPAVLERLFQPFSQGDNHDARGNGGLGLGLSLAKALVQLHGGTIAARSDGAGRGAEFVVRLPLTASRPAEPADAAPATAQGGRRILIIEDNEDAAETLRMALELAGHAAEAAGSGLEGIRRACACRPDVVLCDIGIPDIDGYEVARRLRREARLDGTPLVALSGYATAEDRARSAAAGFDHHLAKPVAIESLLALITRLQPRAAAPEATVAG